MANFNFNKVILGGRLTADPELKTTASGVPVSSFVVAVNRAYKGQDGKPAADFLNVTAWRGTAEFVTRYFRKASSICVVGSIQSRSWKDQAGQTRYGTEIVADEVYFVDALKEVPEELRQRIEESGQAEDAGTPAQKAKAPPRAFSTPGARQEFEKLGDDEDLPF